MTGCGFPPAGSAPGPLTAAAVQNAQMRDASVTAASLERGRQLFLAHCNSCHSYPDRTRFTEEQLRSIVPRMASKAQLSASDSKLVLDFVLADRASTTTAQPAQ